MKAILRGSSRLLGGTLRSAALLLGGLLLTAAAHAQTADLVVNHSDSPDPGPAGGVFTYTVRVDNNGPGMANAVQVVDTLPAGSQFISVSSTAGSCTHSAGTINCELGNIAFASFVTVQIQVRLPQAGVWTNTATASSTTSDPNPSNNVNDQQNTTALSAANLQLQAVPSLATVAAGQPFTYALTVTNQGPDGVPADGTTAIEFSVPAGASVTALPSGSGWTCTPASPYPSSAGLIRCTRSGALANGASASVISVPMVANQSGAITGSFSVAATKADGTAMPDGDASNNTAVASVTVNGGSDVSVSISGAPASPVAPGTALNLTITPRLNGGEPPGAGGGPISVDVTRCPPA